MKTLLITALLATGALSDTAVYVDRYGKITNGQPYTRNIQGYIIPTVSTDTYNRMKRDNDKAIKSVLASHNKKRAKQIAQGKPVNIRSKPKERNVFADLFTVLSGKQIDR